MISLENINEMVNNTGNDNPTIWIMDEMENDVMKSVEPTNLFIDDDGDIILTINMEMITDY